MLFLRKLKTASHFSFEQWRALIRAYFFLLRELFFLTSSPISRIEERLIGTSLSSHRIPSKSSLSKNELRVLFRIAWRYQIIKQKCLATSLAHAAFLHHYGFHEKIHIGVKKDKDRLLAHAWCDCGDSGFRSLESL